MSNMGCEHRGVCWGNCLLSISRVSNQNGISLLYIMREIHHSGREPSLWTSAKPVMVRMFPCSTTVLVSNDL